MLKKEGLAPSGTATNGPLWAREGFELRPSKPSHVWTRTSDKTSEWDNLGWQWLGTTLPGGWQRLHLYPSNEQSCLWANQHTRSCESVNKPGPHSKVVYQNPSRHQLSICGLSFQAYYQEVSQPGKCYHSLLTSLHFFNHEMFLCHWHLSHDCLQTILLLLSFFLLREGLDKCGLWIAKSYEIFCFRLFTSLVLVVKMDCWWSAVQFQVSKEDNILVTTVCLKINFKYVAKKIPATIWFCTLAGKRRSGIQLIQSRLEGHFPIFPMAPRPSSLRGFQC